MYFFFFLNTGGFFSLNHTKGLEQKRVHLGKPEEAKPGLQHLHDSAVLKAIYTPVVMTSIALVW